MSSVLLDDFKANNIYETLAMLLVSPPFDEDILTFKVCDTGVRHFVTHDQPSVVLTRLLSNG